MEIFGLHNHEFFRHLNFIKTYLNIDSANIHTTLTAPFSPSQYMAEQEFFVDYRTKVGEKIKHKMNAAENAKIMLFIAHR